MFLLIISKEIFEFFSVFFKNSVKKFSCFGILLLIEELFNISNSYLKIIIRLLSFHANFDWSFFELILDVFHGKEKPLTKHRCIIREDFGGFVNFVEIVEACSVSKSISFSFLCFRFSSFGSLRDLCRK